METVSSSVFLLSFQIAWLKLTPCRGCLLLSRKKLTILQYQLSCLINNEIKQYRDYTFPTKYINTMFSSSVSFIKPWHSDIYWAVRRWIFPKLRAVFQTLCYSHCSTLFSHEFRKTKLKGLSESRFVSMIFLFRMAGIPFKLNKVTTTRVGILILATPC